MGLRYRKQIKVAPGVKLNVSKSGVSTSVGKRGATMNFSGRGTKATVGIPGSGLSYSKQLTKKKKPAADPKDLERQVRTVRHIDAGRFLIRVAAIFQFKFFHKSPFLIRQPVTSCSY